MKLKGEFVLRQVGEDVVVVPTGETALHFNGMIMLNAVSRILWERLAEGADLPQLVAAITAEFDVSADEAAADIGEFLAALEQADLLDS